MLNLNSHLSLSLHLSLHRMYNYWQDELYSVLCGNNFFFFFPVDLLGLLKWRSNTSLLQQNLRQLMKVEGGEVVKVRA